VKGVKRERLTELPRVMGVGEVDRAERLEAIRRLGLHVCGEEKIETLEDMDGLVRLMMATPKAHALEYHRKVVEVFREWVGYMPSGRGTMGAQRKAYMKALEFLEALRP
jgi:hypothetical protein